MRRLWAFVSIALLLAACNTSVNRQITRTPRPPTGITIVPATPVPTDNPTVTPPPIIARGCPNTPRTRLIVLERAQVTENDERLNMRRAPGTDNAIIRPIAPGEIVFVLDGPVCTNEYAWYQVRHEGDVGWVAEGDFEEYFIQPYLPG